VDAVGFLGNDLAAVDSSARRHPTVLDALCRLSTRLLKKSTLHGVWIRPI
jgi:hypothetical protein